MRIVNKLKIMCRRYRELNLSRPKDISFLKSRNYSEFMSHLVSNVNEERFDEAELKTPSFVYRHSEESRKRFGVFRWRGIYESRLLLFSLLKQSKCIIDLGGAASPLGCGSKVLDLLSEDCFGRPVPYQSFDQIPPGSVDLVFSSHALEHIPDLESVFAAIHAALGPEGTFFFHVPAYTCTRWRSGIHTSTAYNDHHHDFFLSAEHHVQIANLKNPVEIDTYIKTFFKVKGAWYCGDNSIILYGEKH